MKKVMRWGTCVLLLCFAVAISPILGQQAFAQTTINASDVKGSALTLEDDTVLNMDADLKLKSIVSDDYKLTIEGDGTLQVNKGIDVAKLKIDDELAITEPKDAKVSKGTVVNDEGEPVEKVVISVVAEKYNAEPTDAGASGNEPADNAKDGSADTKDGGTRALVTVTFDVQGHGTAPDAVSVNQGEKVSKPEDPTADCYTFDGWYNEPECTNPHEFDDPVDDSITVYAKWKSSHTLEHISAKDATCTDGNIEYWHCTKCDSYFKAEGATDADKINQSDTVIAGKGHTLTHVAAAAATCTDDGNVKYDFCSVCNNYFINDDLTKPVDKSKVIVNALGHNMTHTKAKAATCTKAGNKEYWTCSRCGGVFSDAAGKNSIKKASTTIAKTGHDWGKWEVVKEASTTEKGLKRRVCKNNSKHVQEKEIPMVIAYSFTKGANSTWTKGSNSGLEIDLKRNVDDDKTYDLFKGLSVDDKVVDPKNYTVAKGGLKLTLNKTYLENLSVGNHKVKFTFEDGDANTTLTIKAKNSSAGGNASGSGNGTTANTGDNIPVAAIIGIVLVAAAALAGIVVARRRMA